MKLKALRVAGTLIGLLASAACGDNGGITDVETPKLTSIQVTASISGRPYSR